MSTERKPSIAELIEALELHLSPRTDPDHCEACPYDEEQREEPQTTCQYRLMRDCLDMLKRIIKQEEECYWAKDFVEFAIRCELPNVFLGSDDDFNSVRFAFSLGAAFEKYKQLWKD